MMRGMTIVGSPWTARWVGGVGGAFWTRWNLDGNRPANVGLRLARRG